MGTKTSSITDEAYSRLARLKHEFESFSQVINRLTKRGDLTRFSGILSRESAELVAQGAEAFRKAYNKASASRRQKLLKALEN